MKVGRLGEPSLPWGFPERCRAAGGAESGRDAAVVEGSHYALRTEERMCIGWRDFWTGWGGGDTGVGSEELAVGDRVLSFKN